MSNRADFLEMREHEVFENPQDYERPEEKRPEKRNRPTLEQRANAYLSAIERRKLRDNIKHSIEHPGAKFYKPKDHSDIDLDAKFIGPKMLTDFQKLHFIAEPSQETKDNNIKNLEDGFQKLKSKSRSI